MKAKRPRLWESTWFHSQLAQLERDLRRQARTFKRDAETEPDPERTAFYEGNAGAFIHAAREVRRVLEGRTKAQEIRKRLGYDVEPMRVVTTGHKAVTSKRLAKPRRGAK